MSNLGICYEGVQRVYRNSIVKYLRSYFTGAFPHDHAEKLRRPFKKEWGDLRASAEERRTTGEISAPITDDYDLLGVNHFFNLFDAYYDALCPREASIDVKQKKANKATILGWIKTIKNLRDPLSHPSEVDFSYEDAFILLDCARRVLRRLGLDDDADRIQEMGQGLAGRPLSTISENEPLEDRLPPREAVVIDFVGRDAELEELGAWFSDPTTRRWVLAGEGGKGKSALAYKLACDVKFSAPEPFQLVLWLSAKKKKFQEGSGLPIPSPDFHDMESALSYILIAYGWDEYTDSDIGTKKAKVLTLLDEFPALVVVDDIDSLEERDEAVVEFFAIEVGQTKSKVLLTTRRKPFGLGGSTTHISGLSRADAIEFIKSRVRIMNLDSASLTTSVVGEAIKLFKLPRGWGTQRQLHGRRGATLPRAQVESCTCSLSSTG